MSIVQRFRRRVEKDGWLTTLIFLPLLFVSGCLYLADVGSDIAQAARYFTEGDVWWACLTLVFDLLPWFSLLTDSFRFFNAYRDDPDWSRIALFRLIAATGNLAPIAFLIESFRDYWRGNVDNAKISKSTAQSRQFVEIMLESVPQAALQLYIASRRNRFDALLVFTVASSFLSISYGVGSGIGWLVSSSSEDLCREEFTLSLI